MLKLYPINLLFYFLAGNEKISKKPYTVAKFVSLIEIRERLSAFVNGSRPSVMRKWSLIWINVMSNFEDCCSFIIAFFCVILYVIFFFDYSLKLFFNLLVCLLFLADGMGKEVSMFFLMIMNGKVMSNAYLSGHIEYTKNIHYYTSIHIQHSLLCIHDC